MRAGTRSCTSWGLMWQVLSPVRSLSVHIICLSTCVHMEIPLSVPASLNRAPLAGGIHSSHLLPTGHEPPFDGDSSP